MLLYLLPFDDHSGIRLSCPVYEFPPEVIIETDETWTRFVLDDEVIFLIPNENVYFIQKKEVQQNG